jgi:hypothetical protein
MALKKGDECGAGSPMAQRIMISRQGEIEGKINRVKGLLDIC